MARHGKRYLDAARAFDTEAMMSPTEAIDVCKRTSKTKFDETIELAVRLGVDPRKADQIVRGTVALPSGTGKDVRVAVFAAGDAAAEARAAGADIVGADDLAAQIEGGMLDFDVAIATPDLMPLVGRLGRTLGPAGLMPNPKTGTVTAEVGKAVGEFKGGKVEYRTDRYGNIHVPIGKASFEPDALGRQLPRRRSTSCSGPSPRRRRAATSRASRSPRRWVRASTSIPTVCGKSRWLRSLSRPTQLNSLAEDIRCAHPSAERSPTQGGA